MAVTITLDILLQQGDFRLEMAERLETQVLALFGASGSGKTTVLESIAGLREPQKGLIEVGSRLLFSSAAGINLAPRLRQIGYVPQDSVLFPHMDVRRNILYGARRGAPVPLERVLEILEIDSLIDRKVASL